MITMDIRRNRPVHVVCTLFLWLAVKDQTATAGLQDDRFMSDVNLEHYYVLEENALSNANVLMRGHYFGAEKGEEEEEEEERGANLEHAANMSRLISIINEAKNVHRLAGPNLESFLAHPVNIYHLFRRLDKDWREGLQILLQTKPCKKWNLPAIVGRLRYLIDNLPGRQELERVVDYISKLQNIYHINVKDIVQGKLGEAVALQPLTIKEQFEIVQVLHDKDDLATALAWLQQIYERMSDLNPEQLASLGFTRADVLNLMASAYYDMKIISEALERTEKALEIDPTNMIATNNRIFFKNKLAIEKERNQAGLNAEELRKLNSAHKRPKFDRLCGRLRPRKVTRKSCRLVQVGLMFYKVEPIRNKPYIVMVHDVVRNKTADILKRYAHDNQTEQGWKTEERFQPPQFGFPALTAIDQHWDHKGVEDSYMQALSLNYVKSG